MSDSAPLVQSLSLPCEHGMLHGTLNLLPRSHGIIVLVHATLALDGRDGLVAEHFQQAGLSTLNVDLVTQREEQFPDVHRNVPLLCKRLLDFLGQLKQRMQLEEIPPQSIGLFAAHATSPVVIRVASLRDHDIAAIVCLGGLIDLAGMLYLRSLESPLLMLAEETDTQLLASTRRALEEMSCERELKIIPEVGIDVTTSKGFEMAAQQATQWFISHLQPTPHRPFDL
jgi:putative phosphoribosyl transferase